MKHLILCLFLSVVSIASAEPIVIQVEVKLLRPLDLPSADDCMEQIPKNERITDGGEVLCWQFYRWNLYSGKIKKVISGMPNKNRKIEFAVYQHGIFNRQFSKNMYVVLKELDSDRAKTLRTKYYAEDYDSPTAVLCFSTPIPNKNALFKTDNEEIKYCYERSKLNR